jgi:hypothetical protein
LSVARFKEQDHPFYKPLWVRVLIVVVVAGWLVFEIRQGAESMWVMIAVAFLAYSIYMFFITWPKDGPKDGPKDKPEGDGSPKG